MKACLPFFVSTCLKCIRRSFPSSENLLLDRSFDRGLLDTCVCVSLSVSDCESIVFRVELLSSCLRL